MKPIIIYGPPAAGKLTVRSEMVGLKRQGRMRNQGSARIERLARSDFYDRISVRNSRQNDSGRQPLHSVFFIWVKS